MNRIVRVLFCACTVAVLSLAGCDKDKSSSSSTQPGGDAGATTKKPRVSYITNGVASFWVVAEAGAKAGGKEFNADVDVRMPNGVADQKRIIEDMLTRGVDGISISPIDPTNQIEILNRAATITKLITNDSDAPGAKRLCYIGMDNYTAGRMTGKLVKEAMPEGGSIVILIGRLEQDNAKRRRQGVIDEVLDRSEDPTRYDPPGTELKGAKYSVVDTLTDQFDRAKAKANAEDALSRHTDLGCMVGLFAYNPPLALQAIKQAGKLGQVKVIGFDEDDETLQAIKDGNCYGTVVQNPFEYGRQSVHVLTALVKGDTSVIPANGFIDIPARQIRKAEVDQFWADKKQKLGETAKQ